MDLLGGHLVDPGLMRHPPTQDWGFYGGKGHSGAGDPLPSALEGHQKSGTALE